VIVEVEHWRLVPRDRSPLGVVAVAEGVGEALGISGGGRFAPLSRVEGVLGKDGLLPSRGASIWSVFGGAVAADELRDRHRSELRVQLEGRLQ
jgi:hypothetical protein